MPELTPVLLVDLVLVISLLELAALLLLQKNKLVFTLLAGLGLMVALRLAVGGAPLHWVALALLASGVLHFVDLYRRWSSRDRFSAFKHVPIHHERSP
jgi:hypothetical protein